MVLQDIEASQDTSTDNPSPSDNDAYNSTARSGPYYDASRLPQPIPILGPFIGFSSTVLRFKTDRTLKFAEQKLHRPLSTEEAQALAGHLYQLEQTKSYFTAAGSGFGAWRWYNTFAENRYPLYKPKPGDWDPNKFLLFKGTNAHLARHAWRGFVYVYVVGQLGKLVGQIIAQPMAAQASQNDPVLAQFSTDLHNAVASDTARTNNRTARSSADERRAAWEEAARARNAERSTKGEPAPVPWNVRKPTPADDDMSPTAGNEPWPSSSDNAWGSESFSSDSVPNGQRQESMNDSNPLSRRPSRRDDEYDASPTGGILQDEAHNRPKPGESAWDRLRRGGAPPPQGLPPSMNRRQPPHQEQREGSTLGDSFTFVGSDEERNQERERAQREFDARIEQERQGKDFNEEKKW